jgi:hypothetical protein
MKEYVIEITQLYLKVITIESIFKKESYISYSKGTKNSPFHFLVKGYDKSEIILLKMTLNNITLTQP